MRRPLMGAVGLVLGTMAGWGIPIAMFPRPHEFDFIAIQGWRMLLVPLGAIFGLVLGLYLGRPSRPA